VLLLASQLYLVGYQTPPASPRTQRLIAESSEGLIVRKKVTVKDRNLYQAAIRRWRNRFFCAESAFMS